jgi:7-cyano-7-deazaguanine synthase
MNDSLAVVVLSGGLDSATALGIAVAEHGFENTRAISFYYGQKHSVELTCAADLCEHYHVHHELVALPESLFAGGVLTTDAEIPEMRYDDLPDGVMSPTYVPFRNGNLIAQATAYADSTIRPMIEGGFDYGAIVYAGMHAEDAAGFAYADCTPEFLGAMAAAVYVGTYGKVRFQALFQHTTKAEIIRKGIALDVPYELTHSCYRGARPACGTCSTCHARLEAFEEAGFEDPLPYATS